MWNNFSKLLWQKESHILRGSRITCMLTNMSVIRRKVMSVSKFTIQQQKTVINNNFYVSSQSYHFICSLRNAASLNLSDPTILNNEKMSLIFMTQNQLFNTFPRFHEGKSPIAQYKQSLRNISCSLGNF